MTRDYIAHWLIGIICMLVWFWGTQAGIPASAVSLAAWIVPGLLMHAVGLSSTNQPPSSLPPTNTETTHE